MRRSDPHADSPTASFDAGAAPADELPPDRAAAISAALLAWYDRHRRRLPWRAEAGTRPDPYHVWLSEIMLQQTTVATVGPYFQDFVARWPTVTALAEADLDAVLHAWQGLGYYARARNLHKCARTVAERHGGHFPELEEELRRLPGVGDYTAAAVAAIAFDVPAAAMDGNIERVVARLAAVETPLPAAKPALRALTAALVPAARPGDHTQAMMDLGATICTPRKPKCILCPLAPFCAARAAGLAEDLPVKAKKKAKPTRRAVVFWVTDPSGAVLLRRRAESGLLGGLMEVPSSPWIEDGASDPDEAAARAAAPIDVAWRVLPGRVRHTFTHFHLDLTVAVGRVSAAEAGAGTWVPIEKLGDHALPTLMKKVVRHALAHAG